MRGKKTERAIKEMMQELPTNKIAERRDFVEFLLNKSKCRTSRKLRQNWAGALREYKHQYTSLELQRKVLDWRGD